MVNYNELTPRQSDVLAELPSTATEIAIELGIRETTVFDHISALKQKGVPVAIDSDGAYYERTHEHPTNKVTTVPYQGHKASITKAANEHLAERADWLNDYLSSTAPAVADGGLVLTPSNEDVVIHRSDDHLGDHVKDEYGNVIFNTDIGCSRINTVTDKTMELIARQEAAGYEFDTAHLLLGGDTVTGEDIYRGQSWHVQETLDGQIDIAVNAYWEQIQRLAAEFDTVQVVGQGGNHGELRFSSGAQSNADDIVYGFLEMLVRESSITNVTFINSHATKFTNFTMRGHNAHLRHGQDCLPHIGTPSPQNKWRGWLIQHQFDIAYRGHFHEFKMEQVMGKPVIMSGSICPPGEFEEGLSLWSAPAATVHGVSDTRPLTWFFPVDFTDRNVPENVPQLVP